MIYINNEIPVNDDIVKMIANMDLINVGIKMLLKENEKLKKEVARLQWMLKQTE